MLAPRAAKVNRLEHGVGCGRHSDIGKAHHGWSVTETRVGHCSAIGALQHSEGVTRHYPLTRAGKPTTIAKLCPRDSNGEIARTSSRHVVALPSIHPSATGEGPLWGRLHRPDYLPLLLTAP